MKTEWLEGKKANLLRVEIDKETVREFQWGKDVDRKAAERESLLIIEDES